MKSNPGRYEQTERRMWQAYYILAAMTVASAFVTCFEQRIPEYMLHTAMGTMLGAGTGTMILMVLITAQYVKSRGDETL